MHISSGPIETFADETSHAINLDDPYKSGGNERELTIFATNEQERNADLKMSDA